MTTAALPPGQVIERQHWDQHLSWMRRHWQPGQHIANIGPTGGGKTTYSVGVLGIRKYVLVLDAKGEDSTLSASGFTRVRSIPPLGTVAKARYRLTPDGRTWEQLWRSIDDGGPARVIIGRRADSPEQKQALRRLMVDGINFAMYCKGSWTVYVDEFEVTSSPRMFGLGPPVEEMLCTARDAGKSVFTSFQAPAWVSKHASRQARFGVVYQTGSRKMIQVIAEEFGRDWRQLAEAIDELPEYFCLVVPRGPRHPMMLVNAPRVG